MGRIIAWTDASGESFEGYLADASGSGPGVIVIQEYWGLVDHVKDVCDRFAAAGYHALAPDLYKGRSTTAPDQADKLMMALDIAATEIALRGAVAELVKVSGRATVGCVGFCMGGQLALFAACENPLIAATVDFYGIHPRVSPDLTKLQGPVLGFFAEHDDYVDEAAVLTLAERFRASGKRLELHRLLDCDHAFFNDTRPEVHHPQHAALAWQRMLGFFAQYI